LREVTFSHSRIYTYYQVLFLLINKAYPLVDNTYDSNRTGYFLEFDEIKIMCKLKTDTISHSYSIFEAKILHDFLVIEKGEYLLRLELYQSLPVSFYNIGLLF
jgi:hypothetical protein